jgi:hypothetical protein
MSEKRNRVLLYFSLALSLLVAWMVAACTAAVERDRGAVAIPAESSVAGGRDAAPSAGEEGRITAPARSQGSNLYDVEPEPLTIADCGRCHTQHFQQIRTDGGGHRIDCRQCHELFHAYNPRRNNYDELMPKCADCHGFPHGEIQSACLGCHEQAHAPKQIPFSELLVSSCADCHQSPASQLRQAPSKHSVLGCQSCHPQNHGRILSCLECHGPHYEKQGLAECAQCHEAHQPLELSFPAESTAMTCSACHSDAFGKWAGTRSGHGAVNCAECHSSHLMIPNCTDCHAQPHNEGMLSKFTGCLDCHIDVHDLPVK